MTEKPTPFGRKVQGTVNLVTGIESSPSVRGNPEALWAHSGSSELKLNPRPTHSSKRVSFVHVFYENFWD